MDVNTPAPLVSVIVPIYNVAPWLKKCLDSLKGQSLRQIEVIMVEDGSTDDSGEIAEEYVSDEWPQFRLIHHLKNRGLTAARNTGIDESRAEYLMFVDGDDWVEPDFCEIPYGIAESSCSDMVIFGTIAEEEGNSQKRIIELNPIGLVDEFTAHELGDVVAWNRIYKKLLFDGICYPEGRICEDIATTYKLIHRSERIVFLKECLYHHIGREGSISRTNSRKNVSDFFISAIERCDGLTTYGYPEEKIKASMYSSAIRFLTKVAPYNEAIYLKAVDIVESISGIPRFLNKKQRVALMAWKIDRRLFYFLCRVTGRLGK